MAYQIDFTASNYVNRSRRKVFLRLLLLAALAGAAWGVYDVYRIYNQPTLNMKLAEYEVVARPIEEMNASWDEAAKEYGAMMRYYRLAWAANPTNFLCAATSAGGHRLGRGFRPVAWTLATGGECRLEYRYDFQPGDDKAKQAKGLEAEIVNSITSIVEVAGGKVAVQGVQLENLLNVERLAVTARFSLPNVKSFPAKERTLSSCVDEIVAMRKRVQETKVPDAGDVKGQAASVRDVLMKYLPKSYEKKDGKLLPDFPECASVINVSGWMDRADQFISKNGIPEDAKRRELKEAWSRIGDARLHWKRLRTLDNDEMTLRTKALGTVSDGVKRFKFFLDQRRADTKRKLEPFVEAYDHNDVFNKPFIESDLRDRVAQAVGIVRALVAFKDEPEAKLAMLVKKDEKFTFSWVRWTLSVGNVVRGSGNEERGEGREERGSESPLTPGMIADCVRRVIELGPGYVIDSVKVDFGAGGNVSSAVLEGLLPVKRVESKKEAAGDVN